MSEKWAIVLYAMIIILVATLLVTNQYYQDRIYRISCESVGGQLVVKQSATLCLDKSNKLLMDHE